MSVMFQSRDLLDQCVAFLSWPDLLRVALVSHACHGSATREGVWEAHTRASFPHSDLLPDAGPPWRPQFVRTWRAGQRALGGTWDFNGVWSGCGDSPGIVFRFSLAFRPVPPKPRPTGPAGSGPHGPPQARSATGQAVVGRIEWVLTAAPHHPWLSQFVDGGPGSEHIKGVYDRDRREFVGRGVAVNHPMLACTARFVLRLDETGTMMTACSASRNSGTSMVGHVAVS